MSERYSRREQAVADQEVEEVLQRFHIRDRLYLLGAAEYGVTVLQQQIRALNLAYAYCQRWPDDQGRPVVVVGGGFSGLTVSAALSLGGHHVVLLERQRNLLQIQRACTTRWLHPYLYDWPDPGSERRTAELPLLSWRAGPAGDVARSVLRKFESMRSQCLSVHLDAQVESFDRDRVQFSCPGPSGRRRIDQEYSALVLATGFGREHDQDLAGSFPYWHNDDLHQIDFDLDDQACLISGCGDGGLVDLQRVIFSDYRQDTICGELFPDDPDTQQIVHRLREIKARRGFDATRLHEEYLQLSNNLPDEYRALEDRVRQLARTSAEYRNRASIYIADKSSTFADAISKSKSSIFNSFVGWVAYRANLFTYVAGPINWSRRENRPGFDVKGVNGDRYDVARLVIRHGADFYENLKPLVRDNEIVELKKAARRFHAARVANRPVWPYEWWSHTINPDAGVGKVEFAYDRTVGMASVFADVAGQGLASMHRSPAGRLRLAIHRLGTWEGRTYFQQLGPYGGTRNSSQDEEREFPSGRVFSYDRALTGKAICLGRPLVAREVQAHLSDHEAIGFGEPGRHPIDAEVEEAIAWPILSSAWGAPRTTMVLFADSTEHGFFRPQVYRAITAMINGFIENIESVVAHRHLTCVTSDFIGVQPQPKIEEELPASIAIVPKPRDNFARQNLFRKVGFFDFVSIDGEA